MTVSETESPPQSQRFRPLETLGHALHPHIARLQDEYLRNPPLPAARANLAQLRRGVGKPAGSVPELWSLTLALVPDSLSWDGDDPSRSEEAAHAAMTLYAMHQQSTARPMHQPGRSFGHAVGTLRGSQRWSEEAVTRRFMSAATAESIGGILTHVRGLVTQLRAAEQGLDYARLADDFVAILTPGKAQFIRMRWGRDFYRTTVHTSADDAETDTDNSED